MPHITPSRYDKRARSERTRLNRAVVVMHVNSGYAGNTWVTFHKPWKNWDSAYTMELEKFLKRYPIWAGL